MNLSDLYTPEIPVFGPRIFFSPGPDEPCGGYFKQGAYCEMSIKQVAICIINKRPLPETFEYSKEIEVIRMRDGDIIWRVIQ